MARLFNVSKIPVREALKRLEAQGVVEFHRNRGAIVTTVSMTGWLMTRRAPGCRRRRRSGWPARSRPACRSGGRPAPQSGSPLPDADSRT
ncbi:GntR family transcriptional regulator [Paracoccus sp. DMF]|uniref:GntR family transcriptional regulator n=1 Tax=Paracoccus sp. DMF TaxID=400837 RepID=UPI002961F71B|nr:GntR family transcriptional regulator [Paracoccus sp. DMF]